MSDFSQYLWGGNDKNNPLKNAMYVVFVLSKKAFFWLWPGQKRKKTVFLCE